MLIPLLQFPTAHSPQKRFMGQVTDKFDLTERADDPETIQTVLGKWITKICSFYKSPVVEEYCSKEVMFFWSLRVKGKSKFICLSDMDLPVSRWGVVFSWNYKSDPDYRDQEIFENGIQIDSR